MYCNHKTLIYLKMTWYWKISNCSRFIVACAKLTLFTQRKVGLHWTSSIVQWGWLEMRIITFDDLMFIIYSLWTIYPKSIIKSEPCIRGLRSRINILFFSFLNSVLIFFLSTFHICIKHVAGFLCIHSFHEKVCINKLFFI